MKLGIKAELSKELAGVEVGPSTTAVVLRSASQDSLLEFKGRSVRSFASWDLLGLYDRRDIKAALVQDVSESGWGAGASRLVGGNSAELTRCEARIAEFFGAEAGLFFPTKNQAVLTCITALFCESDAVLAQANLQAPVADACSLVGTEFIPIESAGLAAALERARGRRRVGVFLESVAAVSGEVRDISADIGVLERFGAWGIIDESAAVGIQGPRGAGSADWIRWCPSLVARLCSFNLVLGLSGSGIVGPSEMKEVLLRRSRFLKYEISESPALAHAVEVALGAGELSLLSRELLAARGKLIAVSLRAQGWSVPASGDLPIVSVSVDSFKEANEVHLALLQRGLLVEPIPAKSRGKDGGFLRVLISVGHSDSDIESLIESFGIVRERFKSPTASVLKNIS